MHTRTNARTRSLSLSLSLSPSHTHTHTHTRQTCSHITGNSTVSQAMAKAGRKKRLSQPKYLPFLGRSGAISCLMRGFPDVTCTELAVQSSGNGPGSSGLRPCLGTLETETRPAHRLARLKGTGLSKLALSNG